MARIIAVAGAIVALLMSFIVVGVSLYQIWLVENVPQPITTLIHTIQIYAAGCLILGIALFASSVIMICVLMKKSDEETKKAI